MVNKERYEELKDQMVWVKFCHADSNVKKARDRENSKVEIGPILVKLSDALSIVEKPEEFEVYDPRLGVDSRNFIHNFTTTGYPKVDRMQEGIIREIKGMGHDIYQSNQISFDVAYVEPAGEPEEEVTAPLMEIWFGEYEHETNEFGLYTGKTYSKQQIDETYADIEKAKEILNKREIISSKAKDGNFDEIAETLGIEEGELVFQKYLSERFTEDVGISKVIRTDKNNFKLENSFHFPQFSADQKELKNACESIGLTLEHQGKSGFESRNSYTAKPLNKSTEYDIKVVDVFGGSLYERFMIEPQNIQTVDYSQEDVEKAYEMFAQAKELIRTQRSEKFISKFNERSLDGVFSIISKGGYEEKLEIPEKGFLECFRNRIANTKDHRQNLTHTEDVGYIDIEKAKSLIKNGKLHINLPEEYMGQMIGAKGSNIKRLQEIIGNEKELRIILHPKSKEETKLTLENIEKSTKKKGEQSHEEL